MVNKCNCKIFKLYFKVQPSEYFHFLGIALSIKSLNTPAVSAHEK